MKKGFSFSISIIIGMVIGVSIIGKAIFNRNEKRQEISNKHLSLFLMMNQWVKIKQKGKNLSEYFEKLGYKNIAIYGMSYVGETLLDELKHSDVHVLYGIDKNAESIYTNIDIVSINDELKSVDVVVVTAITFFEEIKEELSSKINCPIISLEDILYEI